LLVGPPADRARLRASLNGSLRVVGEFPTLAAAEASSIEVDGILVAPKGRLKPAPTYEEIDGGDRPYEEVDRRAGRPRDIDSRAGRPQDIDSRGDRLSQETDSRGGRLQPARGRDDAFAEPLTPREIEVLELLAEGLPNKAIAERLEISDQTVKFHVASISGKLGAANRTDAVRRAVRRGLITL
jgi:DNA-binding CsgD family transcriptional regulator